jgi:membrane-associated phospholipid phosphatase
MSARTHEHEGTRADAQAAGRLPRSGLVPPLLLAGLCIAALALVWAIAEHVGSVRLLDARILNDFGSIEGAQINSAAVRLLHLLEPAQFILWGIALVLFALGRGRPRIAVAIVVVLTLGPYSAELLKPLLAVPHVSVGETRSIGAASWPSGHATAATVLALSAVFVVPARRRPIALSLAAAFMLIVGVALLIRVWHMPSDVLGGYLLGILWAALAVAGVRGSERRWPSRASRRGDGDELSFGWDGALRSMRRRGAAA